ncbi:class I SAM-dependent methyltransferase [Saccharothrix australiensis]|uniref:Ubiquinone/menaquinone biosynthesis C-methylase UbiE n=1 Tax=Saccharothrix australiensis TaxID=2072 RepID=A0A495VYG3_9PSEU|nr:class I SAM-dependent methyltransferase [Saccharothrix australiensis]RKT53777.1 ubiquinone/menaquinone biosynthesis C-methylase UbiE [Saccharothrix australiensis]
MPTSTSGPAPEPHRHRRVAESFGTDPERYDRTRPRYPDALVGRVVAGLPDRTGPDVLDVGCGTGIAARQFHAAGCAVLGVEPDARMADFARRDGLFDVEVATFEAWDPAGRTFDAVVAGQSWHWVDPVAGAARAARVLRPGGRLAVFWHAFTPPAAVLDAFVEVYRRVVPDSPFDFTGVARDPLGAYEAMSAKAVDGIREAGGFGEPERWRFDSERSYTRDEWLDHLRTTGPVTGLPPDLAEEVTAGVGAAIDALGSEFTMRWPTVAIAVTRTDEPAGGHR